MTRWVSTCVLPEPALATTQADAAGSDASHWIARVCVEVGGHAHGCGAPSSSPVSATDHSATRAR